MPLDIALILIWYCFGRFC